MGNIFKSEYINKYATNKTVAGSGNIELRNGIPAINIRAPYFYNGSYIKVLQDEFKPNTQYKFDLWVDLDDEYAQVEPYNNYTSGFYIKYTDGTSSSINGFKGNHINPIGFQHLIIYSEKNKTIDGLNFSYNYGRPNYFRLDSVILPVKNTSNINKSGIVNSSQFIEYNGSIPIYQMFRANDEIGSNTGLTMTVNNNIITINGTVSQSYFNFKQAYGGNLMSKTENGKYLLRETVLNNPNNLNLTISALNGRFHNTNIEGSSIGTGTSNNARIVQITDNSVGGGFGMSNYGGTNTVFNNVQIKVEFFNLTRMFGKDKEPTTLQEFAEKLGYENFNSIPYFEFYDNITSIGYNNSNVEIYNEIINTNQLIEI